MLESLPGYKWLRTEPRDSGCGGVGDGNRSAVLLSVIRYGVHKDQDGDAYLFPVGSFIP